MYTTHCTILMNTECTCFFTTCFIVLLYLYYGIHCYLKTLECCCDVYQHNAAVMCTNTTLLWCVPTQCCCDVYQHNTAVMCTNTMLLWCVPTQCCCDVYQHNPSIDVAYYSVSGIIIINTINLYPLFVKGSLSPLHFLWASAATWWWLK
jgi:hypothetical protein